MTDEQRREAIRSEHPDWTDEQVTEEEKLIRADLIGEAPPPPES